GLFYVPIPTATCCTDYCCRDGLVGVKVEFFEWGYAEVYLHFLIGAQSYSNPMSIRSKNLTAF
ncbi:MAG: hypothetical protein O4965_16830, partial [Trichodesmium sp. St19_bin1]|nr:hypothetical protein [Trichodesmium sp. St19_bin1]